MAKDALIELLAEVHGREPCPQINVALTNGNRLSFDDWYVSEDCLVERWPNGRPRYLVPFTQVVVVEVAQEK
jgi:hypothetical protein